LSDLVDVPHDAVSSGQAKGRLKIALFVICAAQVIFVIDATIVNVAVPTIHRSMHFSSANLQWLITAYSLTYGGFLLIGGRSGDLLGKRRMFMIGVTLFTTASLLGGLAQSDLWLIITRGFQGVGGAIASPTALALIVRNFPEGSQRNRAVGAYAAMGGGGGAVGLLLGGILTNYASWRWIFLVNVPIGALVLFLAPRSLHESETHKGRLQLPSAVTVTAGMLSLVYGISDSSIHGWGDLRTVVPICLAGVLLGSFGLIESKTAAPLMPLSIFRNRNRLGAYCIMLAIGGAGAAMFFFLSQITQNVLGFSSIKTGVGFVPAAVIVFITTNILSRNIAKIGMRLPLLVGPIGLAVALLLMARLTTTDGYGQVFVPLVIWGFAMGLLFVPITLTVTSGVRPHEAGLASGLLNASSQLGGALGLSILATVATSATRSSLLNHVANNVALAHGYKIGFAIAAAIAIAAFVISLLVIRTKPAVAPTKRHTDAGIESAQLLVATQDGHAAVAAAMEED